jgi:hypothetical protein
VGQPRLPRKQNLPANQLWPNLRTPRALNVATWREFDSEVPEFAARIRARLDAHKHKTIATVRKDGSPRISGIESEIEGGELQFGRCGAP